MRLFYHDFDQIGIEHEIYRLLQEKAPQVLGKALPLNSSGDKLRRRTLLSA